MTTKSKPQHDIVRRTDPNTGIEEVGVRLTNHHNLHAWTSLDAYERIKGRYGEVPWFVNYGKGCAYVRLASPIHDGQPKMVSRLVAGVQPRRVVKYRDGNRLNLLPDNLVVCGGSGGLKRRSATRSKAEARA